MSRKIVYLALLVFFIFGTVIRLYRLAEIPGGYNQDEIVFVYDMNSLMKTGHDHHGALWPIRFQNFNDWLPHVALTQFIPIYYIFGADPLVTRYTMAILSSLVIVTIFLLGYILTRNMGFSLLLSFLYTGSQFSFMGRWGFPSLLFFYITISLVTFFAALSAKRHSRLPWVLSGLLSGITVCLYPTLEGFLPVWFTVVFFVLVRKEGVTARVNNYIVLMAVFGIIFLSLVAYHIIHPYTLTNKFNMDSLRNFSLYPFFRYIQYYLLYLSPHSLFTPAEISPIRALPGYGYENWVLGIFYYLGIFLVIFKKRFVTGFFPQFTDEKRISLLIYWILFPVIPSFFVPAGDYQRVSYILPVILIFTCIGIFYAGKAVTAMQAKYRYYIAYPLLLVAALLFTSNQFFFYRDYFSMKYEAITRLFFQYGLGEAVKYTAENEDRYQEIIFDGVINQPYIYVLHYGSFDPSKLTNKDYENFARVNPETNWLQVKNFRNYLFREISRDELQDATFRKAVFQSPVSRYGIYEKDKKLYVRFEFTDDPKKLIVL